MVDQERLCQWCRGRIRETARKDSKFCGQKCRQASHRFSVAPAVVGDTSHGPTRPMRFAYADPPYIGKAGYYPENREVDHAELVRQLQVTYPDGWALSVSSGSVRDVWQLCPEARLCIWVKAPMRVKSYRVVSSYEGLFVAHGRQRREASIWAHDDVLTYQGRHRAFPGAMVGMKPPAFSEWLFGLLGACKGDTLDDLFPGSGAVSEAWRRFQLGETGPAMKAVVQDRQDVSRRSGETFTAAAFDALTFC